MITEKRFIPFRRVAVPVLGQALPYHALRLAHALNAELAIYQITSPSSGERVHPHSKGHKISAALRESLGLTNRVQVLSESTGWVDLRQRLENDLPDLLVLEIPYHFQGLFTLPEVLSSAPCNLALVRGPWPEYKGNILLPLRGGPHAELGLRMALGLHDYRITALHLVGPERSQIEGPFRGLARILPSFRELTYKTAAADQPAHAILEEAQRADLLIIGAAARPTPETSGLGLTAETLLNQASCAVIVVKSAQPLPTTWSGPESERIGYKAISVLVDKWFAENTFHADEFADLNELVTLKEKQNLTISLALPALNEEETVGQVISCVKSALMDQVPLLDEIILMDSNSTDRTREIAADLGIPVYIHQQVLPQYGARKGKGEALWKSLYVTKGDIILWIDTDIVNIHPRFVYGILGPLLHFPQIQFVKGFYRRPIREGEKIQATGGGRVTELTARPLINMFYPELSGVIQPLSGEYGGRRRALERLPFFSGYGVETGLLIDVFEHFGLSAIAQVDLQERIHHNQPLEALSRMSFLILQAFIRKLEQRYHLPILEEVNKSMKFIRYEEGRYSLVVQEVVEQERPPMIEIPEYLENHPDGHP
ncbi:glucosyl-3-phosphoglycerate synthase [uncultured Thermanaerothrix sp.]|uniref:glucosyl-3-phosphoglycerate synthase n=1 Tax=uncultured Thermanaerothrix sp. TaxID=1195149 RepID=UPI00260F996E|nr:glucosyl-3-phosphoglycerate synthase [uncultured Thermanaerothrix sp.]